MNMQQNWFPFKVTTLIFICIFLILLGLFISLFLIDYLKEDEYIEPIGLEMYNASDKTSELKTCHQVKGRRIVLTFGRNTYYLEKARDACSYALLKNGIDHCFVANDSFIDKKYKEHNPNIYNVKRGLGGWVWKPYVIFRFLTEFAKKGDIITFLDVDYQLYKPLEEIICFQMQRDQHITLFHQNHIERQWTKGDTFILMNLDKMEIERMANTFQSWGSMIMVYKSIHSLRFMAEWLTYVQDERITSNVDSGLHLKQNYPDFKSHSNGQSIVSLLSKRWKIPLLPDPRLPWPVDQNISNFYEPFEWKNHPMKWPVII